MVTAVKKRKPATDKRFKMSETDGGYRVTYRGTYLGKILRTKEPTGRHAFYLGWDERKSPRTYRGAVKAAEALLEIERLRAAKQKKKLSDEQLIIAAWDDRPRASDQW